MISSRPDVAGEAVMGELENPGSYKTIRALIGRCAGLVVLVDVVQVIADGQGQELFAMQLISYLDALKPRKRNRKIDVPVAIVFTKTDLWDEWIRDPEAFAKANASALYNQCQTRLERFSFYFSGVAGSTSRLIDRNGQEMLVPLRIEPRGIVEPFAWMINQLRCSAEFGISNDLGRNADLEAVCVGRAGGIHIVTPSWARGLSPGFPLSGRGCGRRAGSARWAPSTAP